MMVEQIFVTPDCNVAIATTCTLCALEPKAISFNQGAKRVHAQHAAMERLGSPHIHQHTHVGVALVLKQFVFWVCIFLTGRVVQGTDVPQ